MSLAKMPAAHEDAPSLVPSGESASAKAAAWKSGILQCPVCHAPLDGESGEAQLICAACNAVYPLAGNRPVLLRRDNEIFNLENYSGDLVPVRPLRSRLKRLIPSPDVSLIGDRILVELAERLGARDSSSLVLVVGCGHQRANIANHIRRNTSVVHTDVDPSSDVDIFCDGHDLPFRDQVFDAVIIIAVLEHVIDPPRVVEEIQRVLKPGGLVYSAVPFMQQVHEGAYDFTRFTLSGHRRLFRHFTELKSGMVGGPGSALVWAIEYFVLSFFSGYRTRLAAKAAARCAFAWLKYFDLLLASRPEAMDGACGTYFLGAKADKPVADVEFIRRYVGARGRDVTRETMMKRPASPA